MKFIEDFDCKPYTEEEILKLREKVQTISRSEYCPQPRPMDLRELIIEAVQIEDIINHPPKRMQIPEMNYPKSGLFRLPARYAFFKQFMP